MPARRGNLRQRTLSEPLLSSPESPEPRAQGVVFKSVFRPRPITSPPTFPAGKSPQSRPAAFLAASSAVIALIILSCTALASAFFPSGGIAPYLRPSTSFSRLRPVYSDDTHHSRRIRDVGTNATHPSLSWQEQQQQKQLPQPFSTWAAAWVDATPSPRANDAAGAAYTCSYPDLRFSPPVVVSRRGFVGPGRSVSRLRYEPWAVRWPVFASEAHRRWWAGYKVVQWRNAAGCPSSEGWLSFCDAVHLRGEVTEWENVTLLQTPFHDCGPTADAATLLHPASASVPFPPLGIPLFDVVFWAATPAAAFFQHWMQNVLPKIAQALVVEPSLLASAPPPAAHAAPAPAPRVTAIQDLLPDRFPVVPRLYERVGWGVVGDLWRPAAARRLVHACVAPPLHPYLWQLGQSEVLGIRKHRQPAERNLVLYCGRTDSATTENIGRRVMNERQVLDALEEWSRAGFDRPTGAEDPWASPLPPRSPHGGASAPPPAHSPLELRVFDHRDVPSLDDLAALFARVRVLVGPHGGCLTNVVFMSCGSALLELFPRVNGGGPPVGHAGMMMYLQAAFMGVHYHMLPIDSGFANGDIMVPLDELRETFKLALAASAPA